MKKPTAVLGLLALSVLAFAAPPPTEVKYLEGAVTVRLSSGKTNEPEIGDKLKTGDSVRTGTDGLAELDQQGLAIKVSPNTVFTLMERERSGKQTGVLAVTLGAVKVRYGKLTGQEPMLQTVASAAGVRGTELEVFAGADGTSLFLVNEGSVTVEALGKSVELGPQEAVEVKNGQPPGEKFRVQRDQIDYRTWSEGKLEDLLSDPATAVDGMRARLADYAASVAEYRDLYMTASAQLKEERAKLENIKSDKGLEEAKKYDAEVVGPLTVQTGNSFLNVRYFLLAALSMRRFVGGRMYLLLKTKYLGNPTDPAWTGFLDRYSGFLADFESSIAPDLSDVDI